MYLAIAVVAYRKRGYLDVGQKLLAVYFLAASFFEAVGFFSSLYIQNDLFLYHFSTPIYYTLIALTFSRWHSIVKVRQIIVISIPIVIARGLYKSFTEESIWFYDLNMIWIICILYLAIGITTFFLIKNTDSYKYWASIGLIIFSSGTGTFYYMIANGEYNIYLSLVQKVMLLGAYGLFLYSFIITKGGEDSEQRAESRNKVSIDRLPLSDREKEVLKLVGTGKSSREIAKELRIGFGTVETYRTRIREKLNLKKRGVSLLRYVKKCHPDSSV